MIKVPASAAPGALAVAALDSTEGPGGGDPAVGCSTDAPAGGGTPAAAALAFLLCSFLACFTTLTSTSFFAMS